MSQVGVSPDGRNVLFDPWQSKALRVLSLPEGQTEGVLQSPAEAAQFSTLALFSPIGDKILTAGSADGRLQLWTSPLLSPRAYVQRHLVSPDRSATTCAAFAPNGEFIVAGTRDRHLLVWSASVPDDIDKPIPAVITHIDRALDTSSHQVRIWAELDNPGNLLPGTVVTMVRYPK